MTNLTIYDDLSAFKKAEEYKSFVNKSSRQDDQENSKHSNPFVLILQKIIKESEIRIFRNWNGDSNEETVLDQAWEDETYKLIEKYYKNYPKIKE
jgi:hypothetical protein